MELTGSISGVILLLALAWQDFKSRMVSLWLLIAIALVVTITEYSVLSLKEIVSNSAINIVILLTQYLLLTLWFSVRQKRFVQIIDVHIGLGDIIFLLSLSPSFSPINFCLLFTGGASLALIVYAIQSALNPYANKKIPLAGILAAIFALHSVLRICGFTTFRVSDANWLISLLSN